MDGLVDSTDRRNARGMGRGIPMGNSDPVAVVLVLSIVIVMVARE